MLVLEQLTKRYGPRAVVNDLTLTVESGTIFGLLGPNGAGKTTTLAMILHLVRPDAGRITIDGVDVWRQPRAALRSVGALIETPAFYPYLSALDNLRIVAGHAGLSTGDLAQRLVTAGLGDVGGQPVGTFSQGMRQRLGITAALLGSPRLLILDEPTVGLDPRGVVELRAMLKDLANSGCSIIFSSHQLAEVQHICDHVALLNAGRCVAQGAVADLLGAGGRLLLRVGDEAATEAAIRLIRAWNGGTKARIVEGMIDALVPAERAAVLNRYLVEHAVAVAELRPAAPSLEEFFLNQIAPNHPAG
ncbi:MAG: ABC transporter ATP-binding protein [Herpetosiphonaceae bacterium]|nr:ABC transporter ATP-binding protein [Herpetosiphonaceae bacterium]